MVGGPEEFYNASKQGKEEVMARSEHYVDEDFVAEQLQDLLDQQLDNDDYDKSVERNLTDKNLNNVVDIAVAILRSGSRFFSPAAYDWVTDNCLSTHTAMEILLSLGAADQNLCPTMSVGREPYWGPLPRYYLLLSPNRESGLCYQSEAMDLRMYKRTAR
jgi:hypothetical protein